MKPKLIFWGVSYCARHETRDEGKQLAKWNNMWKRRKILGRAKVTQPSEPAGRHADLLLSSIMYPNYNLSQWSWSFYVDWTNSIIVLPMGSKTDSASARMLSLYLINKKVGKPLCCLVWCPWYLIVRSMLPDNVPECFFLGWGWGGEDSQNIGWRCPRTGCWGKYLDQSNRK